LDNPGTPGAGVPPLVLLTPPPQPNSATSISPHKTEIRIENDWQRIEEFSSPSLGA